ncbi:uncharacterized protein A4U43_C04F30750 [Asparagus officinalis]|uniref:Uncharacterized protein n=1 Tax=Asparagus officinalis TaxID=4686 RepID=A0A5P1F9E6_ASPOF|nr:uncharacterized protein A4U43_C04F30750 [Asparagus officinalis]
MESRHGGYTRLEVGVEKEEDGCADGEIRSRVAAGTLGEAGLWEKSGAEGVRAGEEDEVEATVYVGLWLGVRDDLAGLRGLSQPRRRLAVGEGGGGGDGSGGGGDEKR